MLVFSISIVQTVSQVNFCLPGSIYYDTSVSSWYTQVAVAAA